MVMNDKSREPLNPSTPPAADAVGPVLPPAAGETPPAKQLTPEEQMALFEQELKETDWGHQPC